MINCFLLLTFSLLVYYFYTNNNNNNNNDSNTCTNNKLYVSGYLAYKLIGDTTNTSTEIKCLRL